MTSVRPAEVVAKGSRKFTAVSADGRRLFVKALGSDQRDADLLYRAYRAVRLRNVGDTRPAASLFQAVEHQALAGVMAERAGVCVPGVDRIVRAGSTALLVMEWTDGCSLDRLPAGEFGDDLLSRLWEEAGKLHRAGIAHRSLRAANVIVSPDGLPGIVDFSFSELDATPRQRGPGRGRTARLAGRPDRFGPVASAAARVLGAEPVARSVPLLQPLALSAATREAVAGQDGLLARTRAAAVAASGQEQPELVRRPAGPAPDLLAIAGAGRRVLLPAAPAGRRRRQLACVAVGALDLAASSVKLSSALTYLASAVSLLGSVSARLPFWPTVLTQGASSYINRVSPANVGGMALNVRYLQKCGVEPSAGVAAVGVNALAGAIVHAILLVIFFSWAGRSARAGHSSCRPAASCC